MGRSSTRALAGSAAACASRTVLRQPAGARGAHRPARPRCGRRGRRRCHRAEGRGQAGRGAAGQAEAGRGGSHDGTRGGAARPGFRSPEGRQHRQSGARGRLSSAGAPAIASRRHPVVPRRRPRWYARRRRLCRPAGPGRSRPQAGSAAPRLRPRRPRREAGCGRPRLRWRVDHRRPPGRRRQSRPALLADRCSGSNTGRRGRAGGLARPGRDRARSPLPRAGARDGPFPKGPPSAPTRRAGRRGARHARYRPPVGPVQCHRDPPPARSGRRAKRPLRPRAAGGPGAATGRRVPGPRISRNPRPPPHRGARRPGPAGRHRPSPPPSAGRPRAAPPRRFPGASSRRLQRSKGEPGLRGRPWAGAQGYRRSGARPTSARPSRRPANPLRGEGHWLRTCAEVQRWPRPSTRWCRSDRIGWPATGRRNVSRCRRCREGPAGLPCR